MRRLLFCLLLAFCVSVAPIAAFGQRGNSPQQQNQQEPSMGRPDVKVWVNTRSGVYHCPGTRWYGNTKNGEYMTQKQAQEKGYRAAYGKVCQ